MPTLFEGLVHGTGESDTGKTLFSLECGSPPEGIAFFDDDVKGAPTARELAKKGYPFGCYCDLLNLGQGMKELKFHELCLDEIRKIEERESEFQAIIWDTWSGFAKTCHPYVLTHPKLFRDQWAKMGTIKGAQQWLSSFDYEAQIIARLLSIAPLVILNTHLKQAYRGNARIPGKFVPDCTRAVNRKARLRVWLRRNPDSPEPIGLILKRPFTVEVTDNGIEAVNVLPLRMKPCTWAEIRRYWDNPMGNRKPTSEETPNAFELSLLQGTLTEDQERTFQLMLRQGAFAEEEVAGEGVSEEDIGEKEAPKTWTELFNRMGPRYRELGVTATEASEWTEEKIAAKWREWKG